MNIIPVSEIAKRLELKPFTVKMRLSRRGIKPIGYIGPTGLYAEDVIEQIRDVLPRGFASPKHPGHTKRPAMETLYVSLDEKEKPGQ